MNTVAYPPTHHHPSLTKTLPPLAAQELLSTFLNKTQSQPHLHPDSLLSNTGVTYSAHSGPSGGLALHHLRRIGAGLRGENLVQESREELEALGLAEGEGDDTRLEALIEETEEKEKGSRKRKRAEEIQEWAEESSQAGGGATAREIESFANTPMHDTEFDQDLQEFELERRPMEGEIGEREGAPVVKQNGVVPEIETHDEDGAEVKKKDKKKRKRDEEDEDKRKEKREEKREAKSDKEARKAEKQARKKEMRREKEREMRKESD